MNNLVRSSENSGANELILFQSSDGEVSLPVLVDRTRQDVWLNRHQLATLFGRDVKTIGKHISNALKEELEGGDYRVVSKFATTASDSKTYQVEHYSLDMIISVGYRVKSQRGVEFRRWATDVLRRYIVEGVAENDRRLAQLGQTIQILERLEGDVEASQILDIVKRYSPALNLLDDYDHQSLQKPEGSICTYQLNYEECRSVIDEMGFASESKLFGRELNDSFKGSIGAIYQGFGGVEAYPTIEEKAAHLLYFIVKNHSFSDGNKRIGAALFLYFLEKCGLLNPHNKKLISDNTLVALTIMIAESRPEEMNAMIALTMTFLSNDES